MGDNIVKHFGQKHYINAPFTIYSSHRIRIQSVSLLKHDVTYRITFKSRDESQDMLIIFSGN